MLEALVRKTEVHNIDVRSFILTGAPSIFSNAPGFDATTFAGDRAIASGLMRNAAPA